MTIRKQFQVILPSAARTTTVVSPVLSAEEAICTDIVINVTADPSTASLTPTVEGKDPVSGNFYPIATGLTVNAVGSTVIRIGKDMTTTTTGRVNAMLPAEYRLTMTAASNQSITYSVSAIHMVQN